jgi:LPS export ABC transporter protein LptC
MDSLMMHNKLYLFVLLPMVFLLVACSGDTSEIDKLYEDRQVEEEVIEEVEILYSDSAQVRLSVSSPELIRKDIDQKPVEIFPKGLKVAFYQNAYQPQTWLEADEATRFTGERLIILKGNVKLYNRENDKLETAELIWDEEKQEIRTEKFVRITQPEKGDTTYGFGFKSDQDFNRFEIKRKFSGKIQESMLKELDQ